MVKQISYGTEVLRKLAHMASAGLALYLLYWIELTKGRTYVMTGVFSVLVVFMVLDIFRIEFHKKVPLVSQLSRKKESHRMVAFTYAVIGMLLMLALFDFTITLAALAMGYFGDAVAALVGRRWGKRKVLHGKSVEGSVANGLTCVLIGLFFVSNPLLLVPMALTATLVEAVINDLEDNLYVPLLTGLVGQLMLLLL